MRPSPTTSTTTILLASLFALTSAQQTTTTPIDIYPTAIFTGTRPTYPSSQVIFINPPTPFPSLEASLLPPASSSAATTYRLICAAPTIWTSNYGTPTSCPYGNGGLTVTQAASTYEATWRADPGQSANVVRCEIQGSTSGVCTGSSAGAVGFSTSTVMVGNGDGAMVVRGVAVTAGGSSVSVSGSSASVSGVGAGAGAVTSQTATSNRVGTTAGVGGAQSSAVGSSLSSAASAASTMSQASTASMSSQASTTRASTGAVSTSGGAGGVGAASTASPVITSYGPGTGTAVNSAFTPTSTPNAGAVNYSRMKMGVFRGLLVVGLGLIVV